MNSSNRIALLVLLSASTSMAAGTPQQKCQSGKARAAGQYALCRAKSDKKLAVTGDTADHADAIAKCNAKLAGAWLKLEAKAAESGIACPSMDDQSAVQAFVARCSDAVSNALAGGTPASGKPEKKCQGGKAQAAGNYALCRAKADKKLVTTGDTAGHADEIAKCNVKFTDAWQKLEATAVDAGTTCPSIGDESSIQGQVAACSDAVNTALATGDAVHRCGDGVIEGSEQCEVGALNGATCVSRGFGGGTLACDTSCVFSTADCTLCGNGVIDAGEECDGGALNSATCQSEGFLGGGLSCSAGCVFNTTCCSNSRFSDNCDGTITDHDTGLQWEKKIRLDNIQDLANLHDADNLYQWAGLCTAPGFISQDDYSCQSYRTNGGSGVFTAATDACLDGIEGNPHPELGTIGPGEELLMGCGNCRAVGFPGLVCPSDTIWQWLVQLNDASFAGHNDWRLPTSSELVTLIDWTDLTPPAVNVAFDGASCGSECTDITSAACSCTGVMNVSYGIWWSRSVTPSPGFYSLAEAVLFNGVDSVTVSNKYVGGLVRAVRGDP